jgi:hypothetical protein
MSMSKRIPCTLAEQEEAAEYIRSYVARGQRILISRVHTTNTTHYIRVLAIKRSDDMHGDSLVDLTNDVCKLIVFPWSERYAALDAGRYTDDMIVQMLGQAIYPDDYYNEDGSKKMGWKHGNQQLYRNSLGLY